ncbi:MAG: hypothetical protein AAF348_02980 [Bacteroidota bacterium]
MYNSLLVIHSILRWLVVLSLLLSIGIALRGYLTNRTFSPTDNKIRHWSATIGHIQLIVGMLLYLKSPIAQYLYTDFNDAIANWQILFFSVIHSLLMLIAIVVLTLGSAFAKRKATDKLKYKTILVWYTVAFLIIFIAIPWPFSPLAERPIIRNF